MNKIEKALRELTNEELEDGSLLWLCIMERKS